MKKLSPVQAACLQAMSVLACTAAISVAKAQSTSQPSPADVPEIIVSASRSEQVLQTAPVGATIITRAQIESAGVSDANEAIRKIGGVAGKTDLNGGREYQLDLRGFGATSFNNTVTLIDGIRISENEGAAARLSSVAASSIERIEILRGSSSVMWGEGATGGVINIILRKDAKAGVSGSVGASAESYLHDGTAALRVGSASGKGVFDINARSSGGYGYRKNNQNSQDVLSMGVNATEGDISVRARIHSETSLSRLPGSISLTKFYADPRQSANTTDYGNLKESRFSSGMDYRFGAWTAILDLGIKNRSTDFYQSGQTLASADATQFSPRAIYKDTVGATVLNANLGMDVNNWSYKTKSSFTNRVGTQNNRAVFVMTDWFFPTNTRLVVGGRSEGIAKNASDVNSTTTYKLNDKVKAAEASVNQTIHKGLDVYVRSASSYRLATIDDYTYTNGNIALRPQTSKDNELGIKWREGSNNFAARYFVQNTVDEIYYDPTVNSGNGWNVNIAPTKRNGIELQGGYDATQNLHLSGTLQSMQAIFVSGANAGKHIPLVNEQTAVLRAQYRVSARQSVDAALRAQSGAYYGSDEANTCANKIPSNRFVDAQYRFIDKGFEVSFGVVNLMNRLGYNNGFTCATPSIYPDPGRTFRAAMKYNF